MESNKPAVGSLSLTLNEWGTDTRVSWVSQQHLSEHSFTLNGTTQSDYKVNRLLDELLCMASEYGHPWAKQGHIKAIVESHNTVPTASGLASSASGMAALGLAAWSALGWSHPLTSSAGKATEQPSGDRLIDLVRIGSGSAVRSLYGGLVRLDKDGRSLSQLCSAEEWPLALVVCVVDPGPIGFEPSGAFDAP